MESVRVRDFHSSWWSIWNRTSEGSDGVRFWYFTSECENCVQSAFHAVICLNYEQLEYEFELRSNSSTAIILSCQSCQIKLTAMTAKNPVKTPWFLNGRNDFFYVWETHLASLIGRSKIRNAFSQSKIWRENLSMFKINYHSSHWPRRITLDLKSQAALHLSIAKIIWFPN